jgi:hypothetical protein
LEDDSIYGFNGKHLGWYVRSLVFDHDGHVVAAPASAFMTRPALPPIRSIKQIKPIKSIRELKPLKPLLGMSWSDTPAAVFFFRGRDY